MSGRNIMRPGIVVGAAIIAVTLVTMWSSVAHAASVEQGRRIAALYCMKCHAIDKVSPSPLPIAPPFRTLHERYPIQHLQEALAEGIVTGHPSMPEFRFDPDQINDFLTYLKSLE